MPFPVPTGWGGPQQTNFTAQPTQYRDISGLIENLRGQYMMMGQEGLPEFTGGDPTEYLVNLYYRDPKLATQLATDAGIPKEQFLSTVAGVDAAAQDARGSNVFGQIGNLTSVGRGEVSGVGDFLGDAAKLGAIGYATSFLPGSGATTGSGTATVSGSNTAAGIAPAAGGATTYPLATGGAITGSAIPGVTSGTTAAGATAAGIGAGGAAAGGNFLQNWLPHITTGVNSLLGYSAADKAADAESAALQAGIDEQRRQYDTTRSDLMPWMDAGRGALNSLQDPNAFQASPGYEWARSEGQRDIGSSFAARGGAASGNALRALSEFNTGLAQQDYNNWWNRQAGLAGVGQNATTNVANFGQNTAGNVGNFLAGQGAARASGVMGKYGSLAGGLNEGVTNWLYRRRAA